MRTSLLKKRDEAYHAYQNKHNCTQRWIRGLSMLTSFQLFRFQYSGMYG